MRHKIRNQLLLTYILLTILPVMIISIYIVNVYSKNIIDVEEQVLIRSVIKIHDNVNRSLETYDYMIDFLHKDQQIDEYLSGNYSEENSIPMLLNGYINQVDYVLSVSLFDSEENFISSDSSSFLSNSFFDSDIYKSLSVNKKKIMLVNYAPGKSPIVSDKSEFIDTVHLFSKNAGSQQSPRIINVMISSSLFEEAVKNVDLGEGGYFYVLNEKNNVVYTPIASNELSKVNQIGYLTNNTKISGTNWTLHIVKPIDDVLSRINELRNNLIMLFFITIILLVIITTIFSNNIVRPIKKLQSLMKYVEIGNLDVRYEDRVNNEVHELGMGFNKMIGKIKNLIIQVKKEQQSKRIAEIAMLQSNIKPHFLYNTLETIRWMSKKYDASDIAETVNALATFFRVGLSKGKEMIPLSDEIIHVESYLQIQKVRYNDILDYQTSFDENLKKYTVLKLILQPFVENAIYHGIKESGEKGTIVVRGYLEGETLCLCIEDDGQGMSKERLTLVTNEFNHYSDKSYVGYGMKNVHQRIQLTYGEGYGVMMESQLGIGTKVMILLPKTLKEDRT